MKKVNSCNGKAFKRRSGALQSYSDAQKSQALKMVKCSRHITLQRVSARSRQSVRVQEVLILEFRLFQSLRFSSCLDFYCFHHYGSRRVSVLLGGWSAVVLSRLRSLDLGFNHRDTNGGTGECPFNRLPSTYLAIARASLAPQNTTVTKRCLSTSWDHLFSL